MVEKKCDNCGEEKENKHMGKVRGKLLCKKCRKEVIKNRREKTIEKAGIKEELKTLDNKIKKETKEKYKNKKYHIKAYAKKVGRPVRRYIIKGQESPPIPKGTTSGKVKQKYKSESYLTLHEKQALLRILVKRGIDFNEATERIRELIESQRKLREKLKERNKSEKEIKLKQQQMLEELYNY